MEEGYWLVNLRKVHRYRDIEQADMAQRVGVSPSTFAAIERGERDPKLTVALKIADVLGVTIDELTGRKPPEGLPRE